MLKKIIISTFIFMFLIGFYKVDAFINRQPSRVYGKTPIYTAQVVSENDFNDDIWISIAGAPNTNLNITGIFDGGSIISVGNGSYTTDASGNLELNFPHLWDKTKNLTNPYTYQANLTLTDTLGQTDSAVYKVEASYAPITLTNNKGIVDGGTYNLADIANGTSASSYAPSGVEIVSHGVVGEAWLSWTNVVNASTCFIYYGTDYSAAVSFSNPTSARACSGGSETGLLANTTYYFKIGNYYNNTYNYSDVYKVTVDASGYVSSSVYMGTNLSFTCTNTSELYYDTSAPSNPNVSDYDGSKG